MSFGGFNERKLGNLIKIGADDVLLDLSEWIDESRRKTGYLEMDACTEEGRGGENKEESVLNRNLKNSNMWFQAFATQTWTSAWKILNLLSI